MTKPKPPKLCKDGTKAFVYIDRRKHYIGLWNTSETLTAYAQFVLAWEKNQGIPALLLKPVENNEATIGYLAVEYFHAVDGTIHPASLAHIKTVVFDFFLKLYPDTYPVNSFTPKCLKQVREAMVQSGRFCRRQINGHVQRLIAVFRWGEVEGIVERGTCHGLRELPALRRGSAGTFDHPPREPVPDEVVAATLPFLPPIGQAMVQIHGMTGMRPSELCNLRVGDIDRSGEIWKYRQVNHKTAEYIGIKTHYLGKPEQELLLPYLEGKKAEQAVFSPRQAMKERKIEQRACRKTPVQPSQKERDAQNAKKPCRYTEFYDASSYRKMVEHAVKKGNKAGVTIPRWTPYQLRHAAGTRMENEHGLDEAQALLHHTSAQMTKRYAHSKNAINEAMARERKNPFARD